jgi:hypothetical protein
MASAKPLPCVRNSKEMMMPLLKAYSQFQLTLESGIVEGGGEESVEAGRGNCDVDILRLAGTAESEEWGTANEDEAVAEISPLLLPWQIHWQWLPERLRTSPLV